MRILLAFQCFLCNENVLYTFCIHLLRYYQHHILLGNFQSIFAFLSRDIQPNRTFLTGNVATSF